MPFVYSVNLSLSPAVTLTNVSVFALSVDCIIIKLDDETKEPDQTWVKLEDREQAHEQVEVEEQEGPGPGHDVCQTNCAQREPQEYVLVIIVSQGRGASMMRWT